MPEMTSPAASAPPKQRLTCPWCRTETEHTGPKVRTVLNCTMQGLIVVNVYTCTSCRRIQARRIFSGKPGHSSCAGRSSPAHV